MTAANPTAAPPPAAPTRPNLRDDQQRQLLTAVAGLLHDFATGAPAAFPQALAEVGNVPLAGAFVSLKRGRHLRSCVGMLGQVVPLHQAVSRAAERSIWEDERFPPVSLSELAHLDLEIWLLHSPQRVPVRGEERARAITLGTHGIQVVRGQAGGLFLPSVATEHNWDAITFLDRVCMKAGLPASAWREDDTALFTFEGDLLHSPVAELAGATAAAPDGPCRPEDLAEFTARCRVNLADMLVGAAPHYFFGLPDGTVNGVALVVQRPGTNEAVTFSRFSLRPGVALQATLFNLVQTAAQYLAAQGVGADALAGVPVGLALLHDPVLHGTVADPHLGGFDPARRALLVVERGKIGLAFDPARPADELVQEAARQARAHQPDGAALFSLAAVTNVARVAVSTAPTAVRGPAVRSPAVAGTFYERDAGALARTVDALLDGERQQEPWPAAMVPHAGLRFSGRLAADVLKRLRIPKTVIVIGPNHTGRGMEWAVAPHQTWALPGFEVASDFLLARQLSQAIPGLELDAVAHQGEHGVEVELPLLARLAPETRVVGIAIAQGDLEGCRRFARGLADVIREREEKPLLLISSDMNHFATDAENRRLDALALEALDRGDPQEVYETVHRHHISMCGVLPAVIVLETLGLLGLPRQGRRVGYATSADVTGDKSRVVGYAGMLFG
jgi:AmmeMemoRadiSam system protein B/AmmeMemoRadiSam system protein A